MPLSDDDKIDLPPLPPLPPVGAPDGEELALDLGLAESLSMVVDEADEVSLDDTEGLSSFDPGQFLTLAGADEPSAVGDDQVGGMHDPAALIEQGRDEYGYTSGDEPLSNLDLGGRLVADLAPLNDDGGAEGVEGLLALTFTGDDEIAGLPPLHTSEEEAGEEGLMEDLDLAGAMAFALDDLDRDERGILSGEALPPKADATVYWHLEIPKNALALQRRSGRKDRIWAGGRQLHCRQEDGSWALAQAAGLTGEIVSLTIHEQQIAVGTQLDGVFLSQDEGETFEVCNGWLGGRLPSVASHVLFDGTGRLWTWSGGALYRTQDGQRWVGPLLPKPIRGLCLDNEGKGVAALSLTPEGAVLLMSEDGARWVRRSLPIHALHDSTDGSTHEPVSFQANNPVRLTMHQGQASVALPDDPRGPWDEAAGQHLSELAGAEWLVRRSGSQFAARHLAAGDRVVVCRHSDEGAVTLIDEASRHAASADGNHRIFDVLVHDGTVWLALGGGIAQVVPE